MPILKPLALSLLLLASAPSWAEKTWKINLKDADISALVNEISDITGKTFVVDPRVKGTVTVVSNRPMSAQELYELFQSVLSINGFAAIPNGPVIKILPDTNARQAGVRVDARGTSGEQLVTRVIVLQQASANEVLAALRPMMPQFAHLASVPGINAVIISDRAGNANAMEAIIRDLDSGQPDDAIEIIPVHNGKAGDLIAALEAMESNTAGAAATPGVGGRVSSGKVRLIADDRTNRILIRGDRALRDRVRALVQTLDNAPDSSDERVRVFHLKFANARQVAEVLKGIIATGDQRASSSSSQQSPSSSSSYGSGNSSSSLGGSSSPSSAFGSSSSGSSSSSGGSSLGSSFSDSSNSQRQTVGSTTIAVGTSSLIADETQNALIVRASSRQIRQIESVLADLDVRRRQVLIQAAIVEVSGDNNQQLGVQYAAGSPTSGYGLVNFSNAGASIVGLAGAISSKTYTATGIGDGASIALGTTSKNSSGQTTFYGALIQALNSVTDANLLSTPSLITLDNQEARIIVGQNVPFITGSTGTTGTGLANPFTTIQRQDVGITLKVTPSISEGGTVKLDIEQEVSSIAPAVTGISTSDIVTNKRAIKTTVLSDDGQTIVLGGLVQDNITRSVSKVPWLGDLPYIGWLFRSTSDTRSKQNLLVFLQPTILRTAERGVEITNQQYGQLRRVDLGLDFAGNLTRLPESIDDVYKGGVADPESSVTTPKSDAATTDAPQAPDVIVTPRVLRPAVVAVPAPVAVQVAPTVIVTDGPQVYAGDTAVPQIQGTPISAANSAASSPAGGSSIPTIIVGGQNSGAAYTPPAVVPSASARPYAADAATTPAQAPVQAPASVPVIIAPAYVAPVSSSAPAPSGVVIPGPIREDQAPAADSADDKSAAKSGRKASRHAKSPAVAAPAAEADHAGMRAIHTPSGNVYYVPADQ